MELVTVRVGKNGVTNQIVDEIKSVLNKRKRVRVKMLKTSLEGSDKNRIAEEVRAKTKARKAVLRGHTFILEQ
jgi:RNA-binding protein